MEQAARMDHAIRVMVVDDEPAIRHAVEAVLVDEGFVVATAPNGAAALNALDRTRPDAILLDLRMPVMDGYEFLAIHAARPAPRAPVIVCSTAPDAARMINNGAAGYLRKPFDIDELIDTIHRFVHQ